MRLRKHWRKCVIFANVLGDAAAAFNVHAQFANFAQKNNYYLPWKSAERRDEAQFNASGDKALIVLTNLFVFSSLITEDLDNAPDHCHSLLHMRFT